MDDGEKISKATIQEFCNKIGITNHEFVIKDYQFHFTDSTDTAVYYTTLNCLAELFGFKEKGKLVLSYEEL